MGHALGLAHPNLGSQAGVAAGDDNFTVTTDGADSLFDCDDGVDNIDGSADDLRDDDVNLDWFRRSNNDPFTIAPVVDTTTYARDLALLPAGSLFAANPDRTLSGALGHDVGANQSEAALQQGQFNDEVQRSLHADDIVGVRLAESGLDGIAGTDDDYRVMLDYVGDSSTCYVVVSIEQGVEQAALANTRVDVAVLEPGHLAVTHADIWLGDSINWYFNATSNDDCPADPDKIDPGACGCGVPDTDTDGDGALDCQESCDDDPMKTSPGACGCGVADVDRDGDGTLDCRDGCPADPAKTSPGACGCGVADVDRDGDGTLDCRDGCPDDPAKTSPGACGCGMADADTDGDGALDCQESCDDDPMKTSPGACGCGVIDTGLDSDGDGVGDSCDDCPLVADPSQADLDGDLLGDACDPDIDGDGSSNVDDCAPSNPGDGQRVPEIMNLRVAKGSSGETLLTWDDAASGMALGGEYLVISGRLGDLLGDRDFRSACGSRASRDPAYVDPGARAAGDLWYLVLGSNDCGEGDVGRAIVWASLPPC
jgi:hypothetical protein